MQGVSSVRLLAAGMIIFGGAWLAADLLRAAEPPAPTTQPNDPNAAAPRAPSLADEFGPAAAGLVSGLIGSKHDFTGEGEGGRNLCLPCHTPHLAGVAPPKLDQRARTAPPLRPYRHLNIELDGWSLLCLGCHDGITATDVYSTAHAIGVTAELGDRRLGTRGLRSHPVGIRYPDGDEEYRSAAAVEAKGLLMPNGRIQCGTCHDAHNTHGYAGMLKISNERSELCLTCHRR